MLSPLEVSRRLGCSRRRVYDAASRGLLPFIRQGRRLAMSEEALADLLRERGAISDAITDALGPPASG